MKFLGRRSKFDAELGEEGALTCCGLCYCTRGQRRVFFLSLSLPVIVILGLLLAILIKALTVQEKFQLEKLSDEEIDFLNPDTETQLGRRIIIQQNYINLVTNLSLGPNSRRINQIPDSFLE